jgi:hypothetical protein
MIIPRSVLLLALLLLVLGPGLPIPGSERVVGQEVAADHGQSQPGAADRIWGRVRTSSGVVYEGFIRWDRNEGSWADVLDGSKGIDWENFDEWTVWKDFENPRAERAIEVAGYRITWDDRVPDFASSAESGVRFGHIRRIRVLDEDRAEIELRSGQVVELEGGSTDLGTEMREFLVESQEDGIVTLSWQELEEIQFGPAPPTARPVGARLHGTVEDRSGSRYTGYISWGQDEILTTDTLYGEEKGGREWEALFGDVSSIEQVSDGDRLTLVGGEELILARTNETDWGSRGVMVFDPELGRVGVGWREVASLWFHGPESPTTYDAFDGGHRLRGTLVTRSGEELSGWIRWDADEEYSWEILDGTWEDVVFDVEFGKVAGIERDLEMRGEVEVQMGVSLTMERRKFTRVTLRDGRVLRLEGSNDVDDQNKGIYIQVDDGGSPGAGDASVEGEEPRWILVRWDDFKQLRLQH